MRFHFSHRVRSWNKGITLVAFFFCVCNKHNSFMLKRWYYATGRRSVSVDVPFFISWRFKWPTFPRVLPFCRWISRSLISRISISDKMNGSEWELSLMNYSKVTARIAFHCLHNSKCIVVCLSDLLSKFFGLKHFDLIACLFATTAHCLRYFTSSIYHRVPQNN